MIIIRETSHDTYSSTDGYRMAREYGKTPNGNDLHGRWVLRDSTDKFIDFDQYRNDLVERHEIMIEKV